MSSEQRLDAPIPLDPFELYEAVLEAQSKLGQGIAIVDIESQRILYSNEALSRMSGYTTDELAALPSFFALSPPRQVEVMEHHRRRRLEGSDEEPDQWETVIHGKDGSRLDVEIAVQDLDDAGPLMVALVRDITERKTSERALRESEARWRTVVDRAPVMIWTIDRDGVFTMAEGRGLTGFGMTEPDLVGRSIYDLHAEMPEILDHYRRALAGEPVEATVKTGKRWLHAHLVPVMDDEAVDGVVGVGTDMTELY